MDVVTQLTVHMQALGRQLDADAATMLGEVVAGLAPLLHGVVAEVPTCLTMSIVLRRPDGDLTLTLSAATGPDDGAPVVRASLAVPLSTAAGQAVLLMQAGSSGAFVLLLEDLQAQGEPHGLPALLDQHLVLLTDPDGSRLAAELADLTAIEQAVGALLDQGWLPAQAHRELQDRAGAARLLVPALARQLLIALPDSLTPTLRSAPPA